MGTVVRAWDRFWFPEVPLERITILRIAVTAFALIDVAFVSNYMIGYTRVDPMFFDPVYLLRVGDHPVPSPTGYLVMTGVLVVALAVALVGIKARVALAIAAPLYLYHWALFNSWGKVNHGKIPVVLALFVLAVAPCAARLSVDAWRRRRAGRPPALGRTDPIAGWALQVIAVAIVIAYVFSVYSKLRNTGPSWVGEPILQAQFLAIDGPIPDWLGRNPGVLVVMQGITIVVEALSILLLTGNRTVRNLLLPVLAAFHLGSYLLLETEFFGFLVCYLVFFRTERALPWLRARFGGGRRDPTVDPAVSVGAADDRDRPRGAVGQPSPPPR